MSEFINLEMIDSAVDVIHTVKLIISLRLLLFSGLDWEI